MLCPMRSPQLLLCVLIGSVGASLLQGCASRTANAPHPDATAETPATISSATAQPASSGSSADVPPGAYASTFDAVRQELRDIGFVLDRVDAQLGVITTLPKGSGGLATPWDREQSSLADEAADAMHRAQRIVRVEFTTVDSASGQVGGGGDLRSFGGPLRMHVSAVLQRVNVPGWRLNTLAVLNSTYARDPALDARGMATYAVPVRQDDELARWLTDRIVGRASASAGASAGGSR